MRALPAINCYTTGGDTGAPMSGGHSRALKPCGASAIDTESPFCKTTYTRERNDFPCLREFSDFVLKRLSFLVNRDKNIARYVHTMYI